MDPSVIFLGFGEAAQTFCGDPGWRAKCSGYDIKLAQQSTRGQKLTEFEKLGVEALDDVSDAISGADIILSLVTADEAEAAAKSVARFTKPDAIYFDMNSVAPQQKRASSKIFDAAGARYVDAAIMAPVQPAALRVPILLSGPGDDTARQTLSELGFSNVDVVGSDIGSASTIKMVRSVMIKGIEALTAECLLAANAAGVSDEVLQSLGDQWLEQSNYNLERMLVHGERRAVEMDQVCATLENLGVPPLMSRNAATLQRKLGEIGQGAAPDDLTDKLNKIARLSKAPDA
ncbi:MAG: DUF1932 domain-containing protein [Pseudomonadota bacterium]